MAPEIMEGRSYSGTAVDIYALGVVLFALVTKSTPFQSLGKLNPGQTVLASDKLYQLFCLDKNSYYGRYAQCNLSMEFRSLIDSMLNANPLLRPTHADLLMHPWVANQEVTAE
jgi:serine/threonine protein kinase